MPASQRAGLLRIVTVDRTDPHACEIHCVSVKSLASTRARRLAHLYLLVDEQSIILPQIDASELKATLNAMGQNPTEEEIFQMISQVDDDNSGEIEFAEFLKVIENQKATAAKANDETDTIEAFVALGGNSDKTGEISTEKLRAVVKVRREGCFGVHKISRLLFWLSFFLCVSCTEDSSLP